MNGCLRLWLVAGASIMLAGPKPLLSQEFRVETDVFLEEESEPVARNLTLFTGNTVYDFLQAEPEEVTLLDLTRGRMLLVSPSLKLKTELSTEKILSFMALLKAQEPAARLAALIDPQFSESYDEGKHELVLSSKHLTYRIVGLPARDAEAARRFQEFADWYARLNAMRPGNLPPFARIRVNRAVADKGLLPEEIERVVILDGALSDKRQIARSRHLVNWQLSNTDRRRIETVADYLASFREVDLLSYREATRRAAPPEPRR